jgi:hypothetical protein
MQAMYVGFEAQGHCFGKIIFLRVLGSYEDAASWNLFTVRLRLGDGKRGEVTDAEEMRQRRCFYCQDVLGFQVMHGQSPQSIFHGIWR